AVAEEAQQDFEHLGRVGNHARDRFARDLEHAGLGARGHGHRAREVGEQRELAEERAFAEGGELTFVGGDRDLAGDHDVERAALLALADDRLAGLELAQLDLVDQALELGRRQRREQRNLGQRGTRRGDRERRGGRRVVDEVREVHLVAYRCGRGRGTRRLLVEIAEVGLVGERDRRGRGELGRGPDDLDRGLVVELDFVGAAVEVVLLGADRGELRAAAPAQRRGERDRLDRIARRERVPKRRHVGERDRVHRLGDRRGRRRGGEIERQRRGRVDEAVVWRQRV